MSEFFVFLFPLVFFSSTFWVSSPRRNAPLRPRRHFSLSTAAPSSERIYIYIYIYIAPLKKGKKGKKKRKTKNAPEPEHHARRQRRDDPKVRAVVPLEGSRQDLGPDHQRRQQQREPHPVLLRRRRLGHVGREHERAARARRRREARPGLEDEEVARGEAHGAEVAQGDLLAAAVDGEGDGVVPAAEVDLAEGPPGERAVGADAGLAVFFFRFRFFSFLFSVSIYLFGA